ncbi:MAG TPA: LamB/YcsF family protein, partial [Flavobacteriaceae bacterium]|nr:LamB/YcsF family protein [Flavobacteriaceae bacterium]
LAISPKELGKTVFAQIKLVSQQAKVQKTTLHHVKAHGALYNDLCTDSEKSKTFVEQILKIDEGLIVLAPPNSALKEVANGKLKVMTEGFADRLYEEDFKLVSRKYPKAVLNEKNEVLEQVLAMVKKGEISLENGSILRSEFDTICVHSDTPNSLEILRFLNRELPKRNIQIR